MGLTGFPLLLRSLDRQGSSQLLIQRALPPLPTTAALTAVCHLSQIEMYPPQQPAWEMGFPNMTEDIFVCVYPKWQHVHPFENAAGLFKIYTFAEWSLSGWKMRCIIFKSKFSCPLWSTALELWEFYQTKICCNISLSYFLSGLLSPWEMKTE